MLRPGNQITGSWVVSDLRRALKQQGQYLEGLVLQANLQAAFGQYALANISLVRPKPSGFLPWRPKIPFCSRPQAFGKSLTRRVQNSH
jgi:hypothetical protein